MTKLTKRGIKIRTILAWMVLILLALIIGVVFLAGFLIKPFAFLGIIGFMAALITIAWAVNWIIEN